MGVRKDVLPPEQVQRCNVLVNEAFAGSLLCLKDRVDMEGSTALAPLSALLRVHDVNYVMKVMKTCAKEVALGAFSETQMTEVAKLDSDTAVSSQSFTQARRAAQTVMAAVDRLAAASGEEGPSSVFCCVRPPGHHIGTEGPVNNPNNAAVTQGFCLFNNVAIAAAYARATYPQFARVAIVDLDIHHGNGTEDCVQHLTPCEVDATMTLPTMTCKWKKGQNVT